MPTYNPGTIVLVNFLFTDLQTSKVRPALVLTSKGDDVIILGIFSKVPDEFRDSWIKIDKTDQGFHLTGLKKTSVVKTEKIAVIQKSLIRKELGSLPLGNSLVPICAAGHRVISLSCYTARLEPLPYRQ